MNKPQPQILIIWRVFLTAAAVLPVFLAMLLFRSGTSARIVCVLGLGLLYLVLYAVYFPMLYKKISFGISGGRLVYVTGVLTSRVIALPVAEIRYVTVARTAVDKLFGLSSVIVTAPGSRLMIAGLKASDADKLALALLPSAGKGGE